MGVLNIADQVRDVSSQSVAYFKLLLVRSLRLNAEPDTLASNLTIDYYCYLAYLTSNLHFYHAFDYKRNDFAVQLRSGY